ncbi:amidohydrolase family protein [Rugosimonospora acidiphila]|uniref:Amidohydrolase family protein n=1 Tax=Rugosimonospora acidiphila TaxID=556531 RepID=A0ABP9RSU6_9ACTN
MNPQNPVIDFHTHVLDETSLEAGRGKAMFWASPRAESQDRDSHFDKMLKPELHLADMDRRGVDRTVISSSTVIAGTSWACAEEEYDLVRRANDSVAAWVAGYPDRFIGSFTLPLQSVDNSLREIDRATGELGITVANLPANSKGVYLGDEPMLPLWRSFAANGVATFVHPDGTPDPWFRRYALWNSIGQPIEEARVMASLIYGGIVEKFAEVPIVMAHGGGFFPHYCARMDRNVQNRPETAVNITKLPSDYLTQFYYDTCVYSPETLDALVRVVGLDRLVLGSDYPVGSPDPVGWVRGARSVAAADEATVNRILGGTAARVLDLASS